MNELINPDGTVQYDKPFDGYNKVPKGGLVPTAEPVKDDWKKRTEVATKDKK